MTNSNLNKMMRGLADHSHLVIGIIESIQNVDFDTAVDGQTTPCRVTITLKDFSPENPAFNQFVGFYDPLTEKPLTMKEDWLRIVNRTIQVQASLMLTARTWVSQMLGEI